MNQHEETTSSASEWIPDARLDYEEPRAGAPVPADDEASGEHRHDRWRSGGRRVIVAGSVALAVAGGIGIGLVGSGGTNGGVDQSVNASSTTDALRSQGRVTVDEPAPQASRVPAVARLTNLGPSEAALLGAVAVRRAERGDARVNRNEDSARAALRSVLPIDADHRYLYVRSVGAVATVFQELGEQAGTVSDKAALREASAGLRARRDRLFAISAGLNFSPYVPSNRLQRLIEVTNRRLTGLIDLGRAVELRQLSALLQRVGGDVAADLEAAAAAASVGEQMDARRLLTRVDRRLGDIVAPLNPDFENGGAST